MQHEDVTKVVWQDKRVVLLLFTNSDPQTDGDLLIVFSVQGTGGSPTGSDPENRVGDQDIGSSDRPVLSELQVPGETDHCPARTRPLG